MNIVQPIFSSIIMGIAGFGVYFLKDLAHEISDLNAKMAVVIVDLSKSDDTLKDHENRIRNLEEKVHAR